VGDNLLDQLTERISRRSREPVNESEVTEDYGAFGWLRGVRDRALYLEFRLKDGSMHAFGYSWLESVTFDPSDSITLKFTGQTVKIHGCNLNAECGPNVTLVNGILRHKVPWLQQADRPLAMWGNKKASIIEAIEWHPN
jgi:hypothetical protein